MSGKTRSLSEKVSTKNRPKGSELNLCLFTESGKSYTCNVYVTNNNRKGVKIDNF